MRVVDDVAGEVFEQEITVDLLAGTQFLLPRPFMNKGLLQRQSPTTARGSKWRRTSDDRISGPPALGEERRRALQPLSRHAPTQVA